MDLKGRIVEANQKTLEFFGGGKKDLLGKHFKDLGVLTMKELPRIIKVFKQIIKGEDISINIEIIDRQGIKRYLESIAGLIKVDRKKLGIMA